MARLEHLETENAAEFAALDDWRELDALYVCFRICVTPLLHTEVCKRVENLSRAEGVFQDRYEVGR